MTLDFTPDTVYLGAFPDRAYVAPSNNSDSSLTDVATTWIVSSGLSLAFDAPTPWAGQVRPGE